MKNLTRKILMVFACVLVYKSAVSADVNQAGIEQPKVKAAVIVCKGLIDEGLYKSIRRRSQTAIDAGAEYLVYEISTYGGLLNAADDISKYFILEVGKKAHTVAYITTEAISAGAMISVSCRDIIMLENTTIGDCAPIQLGAKLEGVEREKAESFTRAAFKRAAEANGYPVALLEAMVSIQSEVYRVRNLETQEYEFFEKQQMPKDPNIYDIENKKLIISDTQILTLTASEAFQYGIARAQVKDQQGVFDFLAGRDGIKFSEPVMVLPTMWSEEMVRWVNSPAIMGVLVLVAMLAVYLELSTPGVGLPGLVAVICITIIVGSKYLIGLANWVEVALFIMGVLLLAVELFVLPGFGIAGFLGIICILGGLFGMLVKNPPDKLPWPESAFDWDVFTSGALGLVLGFAGFIILAWILAKYLPRLEVLTGLMLTPAVAKQGTEFEVSMTSPPESKLPSVNVGDVGEVVSTLRPTGKVRFGDAIVDCVAQAQFLDKGTAVSIIEIHGNRVVVKEQKTED